MELDKMNRLEIISKIDEVDLSAWNLLMQESTENSIFQSNEIFSFWKKQRGHQPYLFAIEDLHKKLVGICLVVIISNGSSLKKYLTRRAIIYGGPIFCEECDKKEVLSFLFESLDSVLSSKAIYIEFRNFHDYAEVRNIYEENNYKYIAYQNYKITLTQDEEVLAQFNSEKRRQIRKGLREGVTISYKKTDQNIKGVYDSIDKIYSNKIKKPLPTLDFFKNLMQLGSSGLAAILFEDKIIGGAFFLYDKETIYDWYRGGLDRDYKKQYPSTIAAWAVMKYGLDHNIGNFDFMGAGIKGEEYGVRKFKSQFGGDLIEHGRFMKYYRPQLYNLGKLGLKILKNIS